MFLDTHLPSPIMPSVTTQTCHQQRFHAKNKIIVQGVQLKSGPYFNMSNLFTKIYNMLYYTANLYLQ